MLTLSSGEMRWLAEQALSLNCGMRITRPLISAGSSSRQRRFSAIWPSHSLPWVPPKAATPPGAGLFNPLMTVSGTTEKPQLESSPKASP